MPVKTKHQLYDADLLPICPFSLSTLPLRYYWHNKQKKAPKSLQKASTNFKKKEYPRESKNIHEYSKWCFIRSLTSSCQCLECQFFPLSQQSPAHNDCISTRSTSRKHKQPNNPKKEPTGILSGYLSLMRADSACLLSGMGKNKMFNSWVQRKNYATKYTLDIMRKMQTPKGKEKIVLGQKIGFLNAGIKERKTQNSVLFRINQISFSIEISSLFI